VRAHAIGCCCWLGIQHQGKAPGPQGLAATVLQLTGKQEVMAPMQRAIEGHGMQIHTFSISGLHEFVEHNPLVEGESPHI